MIGQNMTLKELINFLKEKGGVLKGRGDGTVYWEQDEETPIVFQTAEEILNELA